MVNYRIWNAFRSPGICLLGKVEGYEATWRFIGGKPLADTFPTGVRFHMRETSPTDIKLADSLVNLDRAIVVSKALVDYLEGKKLPAVEYLPVSIVNHKGRVASADYFVVNVLAVQDCLDLQKSEPNYNKINPTRIDGVKRIVFDPSKMDPAFPLFRAKGFNRVLFVESKMADAIDGQGFSNTEFLPLDEYEP